MLSGRLSVLRLVSVNPGQSLVQKHGFNGVVTESPRHPSGVSKVADVGSKHCPKLSSFSLTLLLSNAVLELTCVQCARGQPALGAASFPRRPSSLPDSPAALSLDLGPLSPMSLRPGEVLPGKPAKCGPQNVDSLLATPSPCDRRLLWAAPHIFAFVLGLS